MEHNLLKMNKKGAMELSINTIIVIVIGVTLLSLGLVLVNRIFGQTGELTQTAFDRARAELEKISGNTNELLTLVPSRTSIEQGEDTGVIVLLTNLGDISISGLQITLSVPPDSINSISCQFTDGTKTKSVDTLASGEEKGSDVLIKSLNTATLGTKICIAKVTGPIEGLGTTEKSFFIKIEK